MPPPLTADGQVTYAPTAPPPTRDQMAQDVAAFLIWTAEPKLETRHSAGSSVLIFLLFATSSPTWPIRTSGTARSRAYARPARSIRRIWRSATRSASGRRRLTAGERLMIGEHDDLKALIRTIPDFPEAGHPVPRHHHPAARRRRASPRRSSGWPSAIEDKPDLVAGIEARGFIFAAALAQRLGAGLLLIRKDGKLPGATIAEDYALEYGSDRLAMHVDACAPGARVLLVDDLIATGGTRARRDPPDPPRRRASSTGASFIIDLPDLGGAAKLAAEGFPVHSLVEFEGD